MMHVSLKADALAKAALQATARALHTAQLAMDAYHLAADRNGGAGAEALSSASAMRTLRDGLMEAYAKIDEGDRTRLQKCGATITSDELIDLLALCVRG